MTRVLLRDVEVDRRRTDVLLDGGSVVTVGRVAAGPDDVVVDGRGGALLPGLHDHHLHLLSLAAADESVDVSAGLQALRTAPGEGWVRAIGWAGEGDRHEVDGFQRDRPVRVQHRSGAVWVLNTAAVDATGLASAAHAGIERDEHGAPTGRLWRMDAWLRSRLGHVLPDLSALSTRLAALGITGVTDATPDLDLATCDLLRSQVTQRLLLLGSPDGDGPVKVVLEDHALPTLPALVDRLNRVRPRPVAVHCVSRVALVLLRAALDEIGPHPHDRIEHAGVVPPELREGLALCVTQPAMLTARGDDYLRDVDEDDRPHLYPYGDLLATGVPVVPSSDAPYGPVDPWEVIRAAAERRTSSGQAIPGAPVPAAVALDGLLRPLDDPRRPARRVTPGSPGDLVLLHEALEEALRAPSADLVRATWIQGRLVAGE